MRIVSHRLDDVDAVLLNSPFLVVAVVVVILILILLLMRRLGTPGRASAQVEHHVEGGLVVNVVVDEGHVILKLLASEVEELFIGEGMSHMSWILVLTRSMVSREFTLSMTVLPVKVLMMMRMNLSCVLFSWQWVELIDKPRTHVVDVLVKGVGLLNEHVDPLVEDLDVDTGPRPPSCPPSGAQPR